MSDLLTYRSNAAQLKKELLTVVKDGKTVADLYPDLVEQIGGSVLIKVNMLNPHYGPNGHSVALLIGIQEQYDEDGNMIGFFSYLPSLEIIGRGLNEKCFEDCMSRPEDKAKYLLAVPYRVTKNDDTGVETVADEPHIYGVVDRG